MAVRAVIELMNGVRFVRDTLERCDWASCAIGRSTSAW